MVRSVIDDVLYPVCIHEMPLVLEAFQVPKAFQDVKHFTDEMFDVFIFF